jgi:hypothetical protein
MPIVCTVHVELVPRTHTPSFRRGFLSGVVVGVAAWIGYVLVANALAASGWTLAQGTTVVGVAAVVPFVAALTTRSRPYWSGIGCGILTTAVLPLVAGITLIVVLNLE